MNHLLSLTLTPPPALMRLLELLKTSSPRPRAYGIYHLSMLAVGVLLVYLLWALFRNAPEPTFRRIVLWFWLLLVAFELYKQLVSSYYLSGDSVIFRYSWSIFPFQLCSTPFYVLPFIVFLRDGALRRALMAYSATFALFGGLIVLLNPDSVFGTSLGINIQTMVHHVLQMAIGVYIGIHERYEMRLREFIHGVLVFLALLSVAVVLNERMHEYLVSNGISGAFNMFFVSPYYPGPIGFINEWHRQMHPMLFVALYAIGFTVASILVWYAVRTPALAYDKKKRNQLPERNRL